MESQYLELEIDEQTVVYVESSSAEHAGDLSAEEIADTVSRRLVDVASKAKHVASVFRDQLREVEVSELEVSFGIKMGASSNFIITSGKAEANIDIKLKWKKP